MEVCLKHLKKYDVAVLDLVKGNKQLHNWVDKWKKEVVLEL